MIKLLRQSLFWGILAVLIFVPLYPKFPFINVPNTYVAIRIEDFLIAIVTLIWGVVNLPRWKAWLKDPLMQLILLFWIIGFISLISAIWLTHTVTPHLGLLHWLRRVEMLVLLPIAASSIQSLRQVRWILVVLCLVTLIVTLYGFGQIYWQFPVISTNNREFSKGLILTLTPGARPNSTFAGHYDLAAFLAMSLTFLTTFFFTYKSWWTKFYILMTAGLSFWLLSATAARVSFVAALVGMVSVLWLQGRRWLILGIVALAAVSLIAVPQLRHRLVATVTVNILGGGGAKYVPPSTPPLVLDPEIATQPALLKQLYEERMFQATTAAKMSGSVASDIAPGEPIEYVELDAYRSFNIRTQVEWPRAINAFTKNPVLGTGYSSINIATDNDYLRSLGEVGILGTTAFLLLLGFILWYFWRCLPRLAGLEKSFVVATMAGMIVVILSAVLIDVFEASKITTLFWMIIGVAWAITQRYKYPKS